MQLRLVFALAVIVHHLGADLHLLDLASGNDAALAVTLSSDFDQEREAWVKKPLDR